MGDKYVVFVDESLVAVTVEMSATTQGYSLDAPLPAATQLDLRRSALGNLAANLVGAPPTTNSATSSMSSYSLGVAGGTMNAEPLAPTPGVEVLEGVSAIVVEDGPVDVKSLEGVVGITVVPNFEIPLPDPVAVEVAVPGEGWHQRQVGLEPGSRGGEGVLIGILDTGIEADHPEFGGKTIHFAEFDRIGRKISTNPRDAGSHGTHVSSIAAGARAGIAPDADLAVAAVLTIPDAMGRMSGTLVQIINGFNWLIVTKFGRDEPGVDVINASLGGGSFNPYLQQSVRTALQLGVPLIAAIGNGGRNGKGRHGSPGNYPEVMGVGATDDRDVVAGFSDWGDAPPPAGPTYPVPTICAPGVDVYAAVPGGGYNYKSGTSMATPVVTGVAARRMSANPGLVGDPTALFADLMSRLAPHTPNPLGNQGGGGRIIA